MASHVTRRAQIGLALVVALAVTACGSSDGGGSSGPVDIETEDVSSFFEAPDTITVSKPLSKPMPSDLNVVNIRAGFPQGMRIEAGLKDAADLLGWHVKTIIYDPANPPTVASAIESALAEKPDAVLLNGLLREQFAAQIPKAIEAGIPLIPTVTPGVPEEGVYPVIDTNVEHEVMGTLITQALLADAEAAGTAAHVLQLTAPAIAVYLKPFDDAAAKEIKTKCPKCTHELLENDLPDILGGTYTKGVVSYLQRNPDINYILADADGLATGLPAALKQAGLHDIKIFGVSASKVQIDELRAGAPGAWAVQPYDEWGWIIADQIARTIVDDPTELWAKDSLTQVINADNADDVADDPSFPENYREQFKALWNK